MQPIHYTALYTPPLGTTLSSHQPHRQQGGRRGRGQAGRCPCGSYAAAVARDALLWQQRHRWQGPGLAAVQPRRGGVPAARYAADLHQKYTLSARARALRGTGRKVETSTHATGCVESCAPPKPSAESISRDSQVTTLKASALYTLRTRTVLLLCSRTWCIHSPYLCDSLNASVPGKRRYARPLVAMVELRRPRVVE